MRMEAFVLPSGVRALAKLVPFLRGLGVGIVVAAPVGPMSVLCMRRTLTQGWRGGSSTGLGIATGDAIYASIAILGLASLSRFTVAYERPFLAIAGYFLIYLGLLGFFRRESAPRAELPATNLASNYASATFMTLTNPPTILSFAAIFTVLTPRAGPQYATALQTILGVFIGSATWWVALVATVATFQRAFGSRVRRTIDLIASIALTLFGIVDVGRTL